MSTKSETALSIIPTTTVDLAPSMVRAGSPLAHSLEAQGVDPTAPGSQRAVAKAITSLAKDIMEGAALRQADAGNEGARTAVACLVRVRAERTNRK